MQGEFEAMYDENDWNSEMHWNAFTATTSKAISLVWHALIELITRKSIKLNLKMKYLYAFALFTSVILTQTLFNTSSQTNLSQ